MQAHYVVSSNIDALGYQQGRLFIRFKSGVSYAYDKVDFGVFNALQKAESVGQSFHRLVKGKYRYTKLEEDPFAHRPH